MTNVSIACAGTMAATTTALRHIENLTNNGLLVRIPDPDDKRRVWAALPSEYSLFSLSRVGLFNHPFARCGQMQSWTLEFLHGNCADIKNKRDSF